MPLHHPPRWTAYSWFIVISPTRILHVGPVCPVFVLTCSHSLLPPILPPSTPAMMFTCAYYVPFYVYAFHPLHLAECYRPPLTLIDSSGGRLRAAHFVRSSHSQLKPGFSSGIMNTSQTVIY